jgi:hypothetical protein
VARSSAFQSGLLASFAVSPFRQANQSDSKRQIRIEPSISFLTKVFSMDRFGEISVNISIKQMLAY